MSNIKKHIHTLHTLAKAKPALAKAIISKSGPELIKAISEIAYNCLKGNVGLTPHQSRKLKRYRTHLHNLASKRVSINKKRKSLQRGGLIGAILGGLLPAIISTAIGAATSR